MYRLVHLFIRLSFCCNQLFTLGFYPQRIRSEGVESKESESERVGRRERAKTTVAKLSIEFAKVNFSFKRIPLARANHAIPI